MKVLSSKVPMTFLILAALCLVLAGTSTAWAAKAEKKTKSIALAKANAGFESSKMADMSDFDPANPVIPTGDTIKIALVASFSGPSALMGDVYSLAVLFAVHDINKRGGIMVDGKKKLVQVIKADHMSKPDQCKKICERMILQEKVQFLWGTNGGNMMKIINATADKYKVIAFNVNSSSDELQDATNFSRYAFQGAVSTQQITRALGYYYGQIRKKEKKFYIINQDYAAGHLMTAGFEKGLKDFYPEAQVVGEDHHKLFLTDFAPYLTKIKASGAEVIMTGDWLPDAGNLLKQARQMGLTLPFANIYMDDPNMLHEVGVEGTKGLVHVDIHDMPLPLFKSPNDPKLYNTWNHLWKTKWKTPPFNSRLFEHGHGTIGYSLQQTYWLLSVIERAKSTDPEKIIKVWENDSFRYANGKVLKMRACDHKAIQDLSVAELVVPAQQKTSFSIPPYYWYKGASAPGVGYVIPAARVLPWMDQKLDRCKGKNDWGE